MSVAYAFLGSAYWELQLHDTLSPVASLQLEQLSVSALQQVWLSPDASNDRSFLSMYYHSAREMYSLTAPPVPDDAFSMKIWITIAPPKCQHLSLLEK
jgi:hypothetical protein